MTGFGRPGQAWRSDKAISGGSAYDMGAHQLEKVFQIVPRSDGQGNPINRKAKLYGSFQKHRWFDTTNEDYVRAYVRFDSGLEAQLMVSDLCAVPKPLWAILGTEGSLLMESWQSPVKVFTPAVDGRILTTEMPTARGPWNPYYRNVADHLLCGLPLLITPQVGKRPIQCLEGCEAAARENRLVDVAFD
jgi:predicted dehydrogenase